MSWHYKISIFKNQAIPPYLRIALAAIALLILLFSVQSYRGGIRAVHRLNDLYLSGTASTSWHLPMTCCSDR